MKNNKVVEELELVLASSYALMLKTQNYHWNVVGENFKPLHELFQMQYEELFAAIDEVAERIRTLGPKVEGSFDNFSKINKAKKADKNLEARKMVADLIVDNEALVKILKEGIKVAQAQEDEGTADLFIRRTQVHEKALWMLQSSR
jgi:starvation-inducible DNA-binding protein